MPTPKPQYPPDAEPMRILIVSDAWEPQVNGVVRSLQMLRRQLVHRGHTVDIIGPDRFRTVPMPSYPEIRLALRPRRALVRAIEAFAPDAIHISTEGPLGWSARRYCMRRGLAFTTSFHTQFPEYVHVRTRFPLAWSYKLLRRFHGAAACMMVATDSVERRLRARGFFNIGRWSRGVDTELFRARPKDLWDLPRPILLNVGRVAPEKNLDAFLRLDTPGTKVVIGDGPARPELERRYPDVVFMGAKFGEELAAAYAQADVFVFPSLTDTFGLVLLEALASGVPVAAFPVQGPLDVIGDAPVGCLSEDLGEAVTVALEVPAERCREFALQFSWAASTDQFLFNLAPLRAPADLQAAE